jgi:hypothetical protein
MTCSTCDSYKISGLAAELNLNTAQKMPGLPSAEDNSQNANTLISLVLMALAGGLGYAMGRSSVQDRRRPKRFGAPRV